MCVCLCYIDKSETAEHWQKNGIRHNNIAVPGLIICLLIQNFSSKSSQYHMLQKNVSRSGTWRNNKVNCSRSFLLILIYYSFSFHDHILILHESHSHPLLFSYMTNKIFRIFQSDQDPHPINSTSTDATDKLASFSIDYTLGKISEGIQRYFEVSWRHSQTYTVDYLVIMLHKYTASSSLPLPVDQQGNRSFESFMWHVCSNNPAGQNRNGRMWRRLKGSLALQTPGRRCARGSQK